MKKNNNDLQIIRIYEDLQTIPPRDPDKAAQQRTIFLNRAATMRARSVKRHDAHKFSPSNNTHLSRQRITTPILNSILIVGIVVASLMIGTATTVYASQDSLPGQSLYDVKTFSEDVALFLAPSSEKRISREIFFSDRRISEITALISTNKALPEKVILRYEQGLDQILELSSTMNDDQLVGPLQNIRIHAEIQLDQINTLIRESNQFEEPYLEQIRSRIQEQIQLCSLGETDPQGFRIQVQQRVQNNNFDNGNPLITVTPSPVNNGQTSGQQGGPAGQGSAGSDSNSSGNNSQQANGNSQATGENQNNEEQIIQRQTPDAQESLQTTNAQPGGTKKGH